MSKIYTEAIERIKKIPGLHFFLEKSFLHYFWTGIVFTILNVFLLWLLIDIFQLHTVLASTVVVGSLFIMRYVVYRKFGVM